MTDFSAFAKTVFEQKYAMVKADGTKETWKETAARVVDSVTEFTAISADEKLLLKQLIEDRKFIPGGRYLYAAGRSFHMVNNCLLLRAEDSREGWADLMQKVTMALMTGAGVGVDYSDVRAAGSPVKKTGGLATGPCSIAQMVNEAGRHIMQGGARRSALWAGLRWSHPDIFTFIDIKNWSPEIRKLKEIDFNAAAPLDGTNISVILDRDFFDAYDAGDKHAHEVYNRTLKNMMSSAEPGFSVDYDNPRESLRNACTELTSEDDSDVCNLGSLNLARFSSIDAFTKAVAVSTKFLLAGTVYSDLPYAKVHTIREKNRRLGLGIMGVHEWLLQRGKRYGADDELGQWLEVYRDVSDTTARQTAAEWMISIPLKVRASAPTGSIGILAETTTGIEPVFCVAYRRRYKGPDGHSTNYQYVIDPTAKRLIESGVKPADVEDAYTLAEEPERRIAFQAWVQQYIDHGISSTLNLPEWGSDLNNEATLATFGDMLYNYLPRLRGITAYPDGCRGGQPLTRVAYETAVGKVGQVFVEAGDICEISGKGGSCGS